MAKMKRNVSDQGVDTEVFNNCRTAMAMCRGLIEDQIGEIDLDLKTRGLLDMTWGLCYDVIDVYEQQAEVLNLLLDQNKKMMNRLEVIENKMK